MKPIRIVLAPTRSRPLNILLGMVLVLAALLVLLAPLLGGAPARTALRYDRPAIAAGQWWRLLSAHLVHLDAHHALLNAFGAALMWALFARDYAARQWLGILLIFAGIVLVSL